MVTYLRCPGSGSQFQLIPSRLLVSLESALGTLVVVFCSDDGSGGSGSGVPVVSVAAGSGVAICSSWVSGSGSGLASCREGVSGSLSYPLSSNSGGTWNPSPTNCSFL